MHIVLPALLLVIATTACGRVTEPVSLPEEDAVDSYRWKKPVGRALEKLGQWLQGRPVRRFYTADDDDDESDAEDFTPKDLKDIGAELQRLAVAFEAGETLEAAVDGDETSEYGIGKWGKRIRDFAKKFPAIVTG